VFDEPEVDVSISFFHPSRLLSIRFLVESFVPPSLLFHSSPRTLTFRFRLASFGSRQDRLTILPFIHPLTLRCPSPHSSLPPALSIYPRLRFTAHGR
jgi:hypothetical protein